MLNRNTVRSIFPDGPRQLLVAAFQKVLGSRWKTIAFRHIDQTSLSELSRRRDFELELKLVPLFISKPGAVFDIGANVGEYTYVLEKTVGSQYTYSIEPVPQLSSKLRKLFPKCTVLDVALSGEEGTQRLKIPIINGDPLWSRSTLEQFSEVGETSALFEQVRAQTLDTLCDEINVKDVQFIKIDVEGHELKVLQGATRVLATSRPVLMVEVEQRHHAEPITALFSWMQTLGYSGLFYDAKRMSLRPVEEFSADSDQRLDLLGTASYINNFFFVKKDAVENVTSIVHKAIGQNAAH